MTATGDTERETPSERARLTPFRGLDFYTEQHAEWFFGRTDERDVIIAHLRTARLTLLYAESGVGKSSLLRAGVAARLDELAQRDIRRHGAPRLVPVVFNDWKDDPIAGLVATVTRQAANYAHQLTPAAEAEPGDPAIELDNPLAKAINAAAAPLGTMFAIVLDQFEELFAVPERRHAADAFVAALAGCVEAPLVRAHVLISVRQDAYGRLGQLFAGRVRTLYGNYLHLDYLTRAQAREAIVKPVEHYNAVDGEPPAVLGEGLVDAVLDEVPRGRLSLGTGRDAAAPEASVHTDADAIEAPFLQLVMEALWEHDVPSQPSPGDTSPRTLRKSTLEDDLGGAATIVRHHLDNALAALSEDDQALATAMFDHLVSPSGAKIALTAVDLATLTKRPEAVVNEVLRTLDAKRILRAVHAAPDTSDTRYEIFHDRLAEPILELRAKRENERLARDAETAERDAQRQRTRARVTTVLAVLSLIGLVAAVGLWLYARNQTATANRERGMATAALTHSDSLGLAFSAETNAGNRPDVALSLAIGAYRVTPADPLVRGSVETALEAFRRTGALAVLHGHTDTVNAVAFSPNGMILASGSSDATIRLWSVADHTQIGRSLTGAGTTGVVGVAFSPDGRTLASAGGFDRTLRLWSVSGERELARWHVDRTYAYAVAFSRDGTMVASAGYRTHVALWNVATHHLVATLPCRCRAQAAVAFSPDGRLLASGGYDGRIHIFDVATHRQVATIVAGDETIYTVAFSRDSRMVAFGGTAGAVGVADVGHPRRPVTRLIGNRGPVTSVAFGSGDALASASSDATVRLWDTRSRRVVITYTGHAGTVLGVAVSPNGRTVASAGTDGTIRLWPARDPRRLGQPLPGQAGIASSVAVSPDGTLLAAGSNDGAVRVWSARTGALLRTLRGGRRSQILSVAFGAGDTLAAGDHRGSVRLWRAAAGTPAILGSGSGPVQSVAFSPDGRTLAAVHAADRLTFWDPMTGRDLGMLSTGQVDIHAVAFSRDGKTVATAGIEKTPNGHGQRFTIRLWNAETRKLTGTLTGAKGPIDAIAFAPDGATLASGGDDKVIRLWNLHNRKPTATTLTGSTGQVLAIAFSPRSDILASAGTDGDVRLWNVGTGSQLGPALGDHNETVDAVAFTPDGSTLVSGGADRTVRIWNGIFWSNFKDLAGLACPLIGTGLSPGEWHRYAGAITYRASCPAPQRSKPTPFRLTP